MTDDNLTIDRLTGLPPAPPPLTLYIVTMQRPANPSFSLDPTRGTRILSAHLSLVEAQRTARGVLCSRGNGGRMMETFHTAQGQDGYRPLFAYSEQVRAWVEEVRVDLAARPQARAGWEVAEPGYEPEPRLRPELEGLENGVGE